MPDSETAPIKSEDNDEIFHLLELIYSENYDNLLDVDMYMPKA